MKKAAHSVKKEVVNVKHEKTSKLFLFANIFLLVGMFSALFLIYEHFVPSASKFCSFGQNIDCGIVNKSPYANVDGISYLLTIDYKLPIPYFNISSKNEFFNLVTSNAFLGFLTLLLVLALLHFHHRNKDFWKVKHADILKVVKGILGFGILYGLYLFYIQHSILKTYCPFCILLDISLISSFIVVWKMGDSK